MRLICRNRKVHQPSLLHLWYNLGQTAESDCLDSAADCVSETAADNLKILSASFFQAEHRPQFDSVDSHIQKLIVIFTHRN